MIGVASLGIAGTIPKFGKERQDMGPPEPLLRLWSPNQAILAAKTDLQTVDPASWCYTRYLFIQDAERKSMRTSSLALNYISRGTSIQKPFPVAGGYLLRLDLRQWAPRDSDLREWLRLWEELAFDPMFSLLLTKGTIEKQAELQRVVRKVTRKVVEYGPERIETITVNHPGGPYRYPDDSGRQHDNLAPGLYTVDLKFRGESSEKEVVEEVIEQAKNTQGLDVVRLNGRHIEPGAFETLQHQTHSLAPVVSHEYFKRRALATVKNNGRRKKDDDKVYETIWGGLYYEFRGVRKAKDVLGADTKATDLDLFFEDLNIGNIKAGLTADALFDKSHNDPRQRSAIYRSLVTGKPREVTSFATPTTKETIGWGAITGDIGDDDVDITQHPLANLLKPFRAAREALFPTVNGLPIAALFNGQGDRADEVPPDVAADTEIPAPYTKRLQPVIGCIRCHGIEGSDGWKPFKNDARDMLDPAKNALDVFGDLGAGVKAFDFETNAQLVGLFGGFPDKNIRRARDDVAEATLKATGPFEGGVGDQSDAHKLAAQRLAFEWAEYSFDLVDAHKALRRLGHDVPREDAVRLFAQAVLPLRQGQGPPDPNARFLEDFRISGLRTGKSILPNDFWLSYGYIAERAAKSGVLGGKK